MTDQLKKDIALLEEFVNSLNKQQLTFPVDVASKNIIRGSAFYVTNFTQPFSLGSPYDESSTVMVGNKKYLLDTGPFDNWPQIYES